ncbi:hypothetical protein ACIF83_35690 [Streptomyces sp. NPDC085866]|uniref:hypothetical protein n=1 Tax=Streptomyces sp. NPDC085866 TaxID=3365736 RepID=UPI0037CCDA3C
MADEPASISIQDRYASQFAADLEKNLAEQEELQAHLERLRAEEAWLRSVQVSLPAAQASFADTAQTSAAPNEAPVPQPRQEETSGPEAPTKKTARAKKAAAAKTTAKPPAKKTAKKTAKKAAAQKTAAKKTTAKTGEAPLGALLLRVLDKASGEPRTAAEATAALEQQFPERARDVNTVRNTLERLVAKSSIERARQGRTVYYTLQQQSGSAEQEADTTPSPAGQMAGTSAVEESEKSVAQA